jgi:Putative transposase
MPAGFLSTGAGALASLSQAVPRRPDRALRCRPTTILQRSHRALGSRGVRVPSRAASQARMGGLCQAPFRRAEQVLAYVARYTHRVAIGNGRLIKLTDEHVTFRWKDYREEGHTNTQPHRNLTLVWCAASFEIDPHRQIKVRLFPRYKFG